MTKAGFGKLASLEDAIKILDENIPGLGDEEIEISDSLGRILADDIVAGIDVPHFRKSAMDGFAVIAEDTFSASNTKPKRLEVIDSISAGTISRKKVTPGTCSEITTGAPLPKGADAVIMVEYTECENSNLIAYKSVAPGENIIGIGSDVKKGTKVFDKGTVLNPRYTGVLSSLGISSVLVKKKPRIAVLSTGDELLTANEELEEGKIYDINSRTVIDSLRESCDVIDLGIAGDDEGEIKERILEGIKRSDLLLLSGGSSLGVGDIIKDAISDLGQLLVHGIAIKPGKPTIIGKIEDKLLIGLPGYPTSALSNFYILIIPLLQKMQGITPEKKVIRAELTRKVASTIGRYEFLPVKVITEGVKFAEPVMKGSSAITTLASADGFVEISENQEVINKGTLVDVILFE